jgi:hypothetical protein
MTRTTYTLREDLCTFVIVSRWILLRTRNVLDKSCRENQHTHFVFKNFFSDNLTVYEKMCKNTKCIVAFPMQQWLCERATMLRCTCVACIVTYIFSIINIATRFEYCIIYFYEKPRFRMTFLIFCFQYYTIVCKRNECDKNWDLRC